MRFSKRAIRIFLVTFSTIAAMLAFQTAQAKSGEKMESNLTSIQFKKANGETTSLAEFKGKVALVVNVASKCGLTPQYEGLEKIYEQYRDKGFVVLGFPANEFMGQEPGTNEEIQTFCKTHYGVQFPVFQKIVVKGDSQHPLYKELTEAQPSATTKPLSGFAAKLKQSGLLGGKANDVMWNFEKFLISKDGKVVGRFAPDVFPTDEILTKAIEAQLAK
jgi:glutathione peroxidase